MSQRSAQHSSLVSPDHPLSVPFTASLGPADGEGSHSRARLCPVPKDRCLLVSILGGTYSPCFLPLIPWDDEGLGQAAVLHVAGVGACV